MLILDLWGISFHPVVVVGLGNDLLFNFIVGHCVLIIEAVFAIIKLIKVSILGLDYTFGVEIA
jgi:hypothetical protein